MASFQPKTGTGTRNVVPSIEDLHKMGLNEPLVPCPPGDARKGAAVFKAKCAACHTTAPDAGTKAGPNLHALFGRKAGTQKDYLPENAFAFGRPEEEEEKYRLYPVDAKGVPPQSRAGRPWHINSFAWEGRWYSDANQKSGIVWSDTHLYSYLEDPRGYLPGTKMAFCGIKKEDDRANLIEWLRKEVGASAPGFGAEVSKVSSSSSDGGSGDGAAPKRGEQPLGPFHRKQSRPTHASHDGSRWRPNRGTW